MTAPGLSRSVEDYLKVIYSLNEQGEAAGTSGLARLLDVQPASVSGMVRRLAADGLLEHEPYRGVRLTATGVREALKVLRRHRVIESFLVERLGYSWEDVHEEAERLEHAASDRLIDRMAEAVGNPTTDPHGAPIPSRRGEVAPLAGRRLDRVAPGAKVVIRSVSDDDPERLRYFESVGLVPGAKAVVHDVAQEGDLVTLALEGRPEPLAVEAGAGSVRVTVA